MDRIGEDVPFRRVHAEKPHGGARRHGIGEFGDDLRRAPLDEPVYGPVDDLEDEGFERCGSCDNCRRMDTRLARPDSEAEMIRLPQEIAAQRSTAPEDSVAPAPAFETGQAVRVRRYGIGTVVSADALSVTVEFPNRQQRCFDPSYVTPLRRRSSARRPASGGASPAALAAS
jgi:ATP-dependent DNA helicase RecQ